MAFNVDIKSYCFCRNSSIFRHWVVDLWPTGLQIAPREIQMRTVPISLTSQSQNIHEEIENLKFSPYATRMKSEISFIYLLEMTEIGDGLDLWTLASRSHLHMNGNKSGGRLSETWIITSSEPSWSLKWEIYCCDNHGEIIQRLHIQIGNNVNWIQSS